ncbi:galactoside 2-alpha-L-fucosyltransferase Sec1-like [Babylonia areolata]|uniref:galactoside 2-alpha-L-fucosyltransferase Sec1-like n=1 Tax=Babylonia areolata TaxID=304850 RepID=UPI003FD46856
MRPLCQYRKVLLIAGIWTFLLTLYFTWGSVGDYIARSRTLLQGIQPLLPQQQHQKPPTAFLPRTTTPSGNTNTQQASPDGQKGQEKNLTSNNNSAEKLQHTSEPSKPSEARSSSASSQVRVVTEDVVLPSDNNATAAAAATLKEVKKRNTTMNQTPALPVTTHPPTTALTPKQKEPPKLLCVYFTGRLGNELFEFASTLGLALTFNRTPVFLSSSAVSKALKNFRGFPSTLTRNEVKRRCNEKHIHENSCCKFKEEMTRMDPASDYKISSYLQSYRYFESQIPAIRKAVVFNDRIQAQANTTLRMLREKYRNSTLVGVHIRHGDMASAQYQKLGYPLATPAYINKSVSYFSQLYPKCAFVVASDSIPWVRDNFPKQHTDVHFLTGNDPAVDMQILASTDHVIISFGTFSWWIGFLNPGKTVYMKDFIRANTVIGNVFNPKGRDYIYPGWIPL